jgi:hypothetical protein
MNPTAALEHEKTYAKIEKEQLQQLIENHLNKYELPISERDIHIDTLDQIDLYQQKYMTYAKEIFLQATTILQVLESRPESKGRDILIDQVKKLYWQFDIKFEKALNLFAEQEKKLLKGRSPVRTGLQKVSFPVGNLEKKFDAFYNFLKKYTLDEIKTMFGPSEKLKSEEDNTRKFNVIATLIKEDESDVIATLIKEDESDVIGTLIKEGESDQVAPYAKLDTQNDKDIPTAQRLI